MALRYVVVLGLLAAPVWSYSAGAPGEACKNLTPNHGVGSKALPSNYIISVSPKSVPAGQTVDVTISGKTEGDTIKGFLMQARVGGTPIGQFVFTGSETHAQALDCAGGKGNAATHKKITGPPPRTITLKWKAPENLKETVVFTGTIALNGAVFWVGETSEPVTVV